MFVRVEGQRKLLFLPGEASFTDIIRLQKVDLQVLHVQDDADVDPSHTGTTAHLFPGQGESGESYPTQAPLSTGLWR